jgi:hypothetical protein
MATATLEANPRDSAVGFWFTCSLPAPDRELDEIDPAGCNYSNWVKAGCPWHYAHDRRELPVGSSVNPTTGKADIRVSEDKIEACCWFNQATELSRELLELVRLGHVKGCSVGIIPLRAVMLKSGGRRVVSYDLVELSLTTAPVCPGCVGGDPALKALLKSVGCGCGCRATSHFTRKEQAERPKIDAARDLAEQWSRHFDFWSEEMHAALRHPARLLSRQQLETVEKMIGAEEGLRSAVTSYQSLASGPGGRLLDSDLCSVWLEKCDEARPFLGQLEKSFPDTVPILLAEERGGGSWSEFHRIAGICKQASRALSAAADSELSDDDRNSLNELIAGGERLSEFCRSMRRRRLSPGWHPRDDRALALLERAHELYTNAVTRLRMRAGHMLANRVAEQGHRLVGMTA